MNWRPSSLPALAECSQFESSSEENAYISGGVHRDVALTAHFNEDDSLLNQLSANDAESVMWAADYIRLKAPMSDYPLELQTPVKITLDDLSEIVGTPDVMCGRDLFDLKSRPRNYLAQMAAYAIAMYQRSKLPREFGGVRVHLMFTETRTIQTFMITEDEAWAIIRPIIENPILAPRANDYCSWCTKIVTCPAYVEKANAVSVARDDWKLENYHPADIVDPIQMSRAKKLSKFLRKWCDHVDHCAKQMAIKQGITIPGYIVKEEAGDRHIENLSAAASLAGLPVGKFEQACSVSITQLENVYHEHFKISKAQAKREINRKLATVITRTPTKTLTEE